MTEEEYLFRELEAKRYKASLSASGCIAVIYLEDRDDRVFWETIFKYFRSNSSFYFVSGSRAEGSGCRQCLKYIDFLDAQFLIAIDSDYRYLMQEKDFDAGHFILQTYTYSFENHYCYTENIQNALCQACDDLDVDSCFSFIEFLTEYSKIVYPLYLIFLYCLRMNNGLFNEDDFRRVLSIPPKMDHSIENNGKSLLNYLQREVNIKSLLLLVQCPSFKLEQESERYVSLGLKAETTYLYVRGHNLYNVIISLGKEVVKMHINEQKKLADRNKHQEIYNHHKQFEKVLLSKLLYTYPEILHIGSDIDAIFL